MWVRRFLSTLPESAVGAVWDEIATTAAKLHKRTTAKFFVFLNIGYSTQSAMNTFVSPGFASSRFEAKTIFLPSGENIGKPSKDSLNVTRSRAVPSTFTIARSKFGCFRALVRFGSK